jgi:hypothetical protein
VLFSPGRTALLRSLIASGLGLASAVRWPRRHGLAAVGAPFRSAKQHRRSQDRAALTQAEQPGGRLVGSGRRGQPQAWSPPGLLEVSPTRAQPGPRPVPGSRAALLRLTEAEPCHCRRHAALQPQGCSQVHEEHWAGHGSPRSRNAWSLDSTDAVRKGCPGAPTGRTGQHPAHAHETAALTGPAPAVTFRRGEMTEWPKVPDSKSGVLGRVPWVRIPLSPPVKRCRSGASPSESAERR